MDVEDAARAVKMIKPRVAIPMHYNTFPRIEADPVKFAELVGEMFTGEDTGSGRRIQVLVCFSSVSVAAIRERHKIIKNESNVQTSRMY